MKEFLGKWELKKNENVDKFLKYFGYGWIKRKAALMSNIQLTLTFLNENAFTRNINSTFMNTSEEYHLDGKERENSENLIKKHLYNSKNKCIVSEIKSSLQSQKKIKWTETVKFSNDILIIKRVWQENNVTNDCTQYFKKK